MLTIRDLIVGKGIDLFHFLNIILHRRIVLFVHILLCDRPERCMVGNRNARIVFIRRLRRLILRAGAETADRDRTRKYQADRHDQNQKILSDLTLSPNTVLLDAPLTSILFLISVSSCICPVHFVHPRPFSRCNNLERLFL